MAITQANREVIVTSTLGADVLLLGRMSGTEALGQLGGFELELLSERHDLSGEDIVGHPLTVQLSVPGTGPKRSFNGHVVSFAHTGARGRLATYRASVRPWLWLLTRATDCRIFQDKTVPTILAEVFDPYSANIESALDETYEALPYCVQYRESDFDFVSRLMEDAGIYYFFRHDGDQHTLVLADSHGAHAPAAVSGQLSVVSGGAHRLRDEPGMLAWDTGVELTSGACELDDFDFENSRTDLLTRRAADSQHGHGELRVYDYPGGYASSSVGEVRTRVRLEAMLAPRELARGHTNARGLGPGMLFDLAEHVRADQNRSYLVTAAQYQLSGPSYESGDGSGVQFSCDIDAVSATVAWRSPLRTPRPRIFGPQTALVVGSEGEEIWTDKYGRVKLQFHWDRVGQSNQDSSCWVRVAQRTAGKRWGELFLPRVGQEVLVEFLDGDPDRPLVTGAVYNDFTQTAHELPKHATRSTFKTNSSKGGGTWNELRFEDKAGEEQVFIHAGRNQDVRVLKDVFTSIGENRHLTVGKDDYAKVSGNRHVEIVGEQRTVVQKDLSLKVNGDTHHKTGGNIAQTAGSNIDLKGGTNVTIEAGTTLTLKVGGNSVVLSAAGIAINGTQITIDGSAQVSINGGGGGAAKAAKDASPQAPDAPKEADDGKK